MNLIYGVIGTYALSNCSGSSLAKKQFFRKITPSLFFDKASCTRQFESELSLHSLASLFPIKEGVFSKTYPSFLTLKEGSTSHLGLLPSGKKRKTALRCSEPLRSKVGGPSKVYAKLCGLGPPGDSCLQLIIYNLQFAVCSLLFIRGKLADELQNYCFFLGGFEEKA